MSGPRVPWTPQPLAQLSARYLAAIAPFVDHRDARRADFEPPSGDPRHVFDCEDGLRLIVSRERCLDGREGVHISASFYLEAPPYVRTAEDQIAWITDRWQTLSRSTRSPELLMISEGNIPHFFVERVM